MNTETVSFPATIPELVAWRVARAAEEGKTKPWLFHEGESWTLDDVADRAPRRALIRVGVRHDPDSRVGRDHPAAVAVPIAAHIACSLPAPQQHPGVEQCP